jgi:hypothetical protein
MPEDTSRKDRYLHWRADHIELIREAPRPEHDPLFYDPLYVCRDCLPLVGEPPIRETLDRAIHLGESAIFGHWEQYHEEAAT